MNTTLTKDLMERTKRQKYKYDDAANKLVAETSEFFTDFLKTYNLDKDEINVLVQNESLYLFVKTENDIEIIKRYDMKKDISDFTNIIRNHILFNFFTKYHNAGFRATLISDNVEIHNKKNSKSLISKNYKSEIDKKVLLSMKQNNLKQQKLYNDNRLSVIENLPQSNLLFMITLEKDLTTNPLSTLEIPNTKLTADYIEHAIRKHIVNKNIKYLMSEKINLDKKILTAIMNDSIDKEPLTSYEPMALTYFTLKDETIIKHHCENTGILNNNIFTQIENALNDMYKKSGIELEMNIEDKNEYSGYITLHMGLKKHKINMGDENEYNGHLTAHIELKKY